MSLFGWPKKYLGASTATRKDERATQKIVLSDRESDSDTNNEEMKEKEKEWEKERLKMKKKEKENETEIQQLKKENKDF